jgi:hypothetical protein
LSFNPKEPSRAPFLWNINHSGPDSKPKSRGQHHGILAKGKPLRSSAKSRKANELVAAGSPTSLRIQHDRIEKLVAEESLWMGKDSSG